MVVRKTGRIFIILTSLLALLAAIFISDHTGIARSLNHKIYDSLVRARYNVGRPPAAITDILLVTIDNDTLNNINERWPYPRAYFAKVVNNLKKAGAKVIALDFLFYGASSEKEDELLGKSFRDARNVVLGAAIDDEGRFRATTVPAIAENISSGIVTKMQDSDGKTRKSLTYLIDLKNPQKIALSWELAILKMDTGIERIDKLDIPLADPERKSFLINFRAHSTDFKRVSFYRVAQNDFDGANVRGKIVIIGFLSSIFGDIHDTPLGWLPGIVLNADTFLTLYTEDFLKKIPRPVELFIALLCALFAAGLISYFPKRIAYPAIALEIALFIFASFMLLSAGSLVWDYALFPIAILISAGLCFACSRQLPHSSVRR